MRNFIPCRLATLCPTTLLRPGRYIHCCYYSLTVCLTEVTIAVRLGCIKTLPVQRLSEPFMPRNAVFKPSERPQRRDQHHSIVSLILTCL